MKLIEFGKKLIEKLKIKLFIFISIIVVLLINVFLALHFENRANFFSESIGGYLSHLVKVGDNLEVSRQLSILEANENISNAWIQFNSNNKQYKIGKSIQFEDYIKLGENTYINIGSSVYLLSKKQLDLGKMDQKHSLFILFEIQYTYSLIGIIISIFLSLSVTFFIKKSIYTLIDKITKPISDLTEFILLKDGNNEFTREFKQTDF